MDSVGTHIKTDGNIYSALVNFYDEHPFTVPVQIFTGAPVMFTRKPISNAAEIRDYVVKNCIHVYIHSAYLINLANEEPKGFKCMAADLDSSNIIGARGVVVHVGKSLKNSVSSSLEIMKKNILKLLTMESYFKVILETPAGQGTEMLTDINDFIKFCKEFSEYDNFSVCIDTCHVFAAGYEPDYYITTVLDAGIKVSLCHFNDSKEPKGSRKDRHAEYNTGCIHKEVLDNCIKICNENSIDMVIE